MTTIPIVEFIHARLTEDETEASGSSNQRRPREIAAHRRILELHPTNTGSYARPEDQYCDCSTEDGLIYAGEPCETKRILAGIYNDHPDYQTEWAP